MKNQQLAPLFFMLVCIEISFPAKIGSGSGSGSDEDLKEEAICWSVTSPHEENVSTNSTRAVLQARCTSVCKSQLETDGCLWLKDIMSDWQLYQNITSCVKGCITKPQYFNSCTDTCDTPSCSLGCDVYYTLIETNDDKAIPNAPTFPLMLIGDINSSGVYFLNNSWWTGDSESVINITATVIVIKVFVIDEVMNYYIVKEGFFDILSLEMFSCQAITVSYAFANQHGVSSYSAPTALIVPGIIIRQPVSVLISSLRIEFIYDNRHGFFGHYKVNLTWTNPTDLVSIAYFELHILSYSNHCGSSNVFTNIYPSKNHNTIYVVQAEQPTNLPIASCLYDVKIVSVSLSNSPFQPAESDLQTIVIPPYDPPSPLITCTHYIDQNSLFTVVVELLISTYIAAENPVERVFIISRLVEYGNDGSIVDQDAFPLIQRSVLQANNTYYLPRYKPKESSNFVYEFSIILKWNDELIYQPTIKTYQCAISALSPKPDVIPHVELIEPVMYLSTTILRIVIQWISPDIKDEFTSYIVCLNRKPLQYDEPSLQYSICEAIYEENQTTLTWDTNFTSVEGLHCLYLQISAQNKYLSGNWSEPLTIPLDDECEESVMRNTSVMTTIIPSVTTNITSSTDTDFRLFVWITAGVMFVAITTCILLCFAIPLYWKQKRRKINQANYTEQTKEVRGDVETFPSTKM